MGISSISRTSVWVFLAAFSLAATLEGCKTAPKTQAETPTSDQPLVLAPPAETMGPAEAYGPFDTTANFPVQRESVVVIFDHGKSHGFLALGALKALREKKVPLKAIYSAENSAVISALFVHEPTVNKFDWRVLEFGKFLLKDSSADSVRSWIGSTLKSDRLDSWKPIFHCYDATRIFPSDGLAADALKACWNESDRPVAMLPIVDAWNRYHSPVVVVSPRGPNASEAKFIQGKDVVWIYAPLKGFDNEDYKARNEIQFIGRRQIEKRQADIARLLEAPK